MQINLYISESDLDMQELKVNNIFKLQFRITIIQIYQKKEKLREALKNGEYKIAFF